MFGSHLSIAGGLAGALLEARRLKFDTVQVFTKNQRQWRVSPLSDAAARDWLDELSRLGWSDRTVSHASYLINLASPDRSLRERSIGLMREEIERCERLRIPRLVFHPGSHKSEPGERSRRRGVERVGDALARLIKETPGYRTTLCVEDTAGGGSSLGGPFEDLAEIAERAAEAADAGGRLGFCLDTCHALAAGYDIRSEAKMARTLDRFDEVCGLDRLAAVHLNDSKGDLASHVDRHEHIGDGCVGKGAFAAIVNRSDLAGVPKILETPKGETPKGTPWDRVNLRRLRRLIRGQAKAGQTAIKDAVG